ncbi:unnamed protein product [Phyllotreta striolata]|uniref:Dual oxidase maturation factor 1 n=1 Tax=Phyllotreta striolata TaxID=444603 RepID=A0A9N9TKI6_PHYSR|nr:unnamed protein product [Phyllotreta striolata]
MTPSPLTNSMGMFLLVVLYTSSLGRNEGFPSNYGPHATPVTVDVLDAGFITAGLILGISLFISIPTPRLKANLSVYLRVSLSITIGTLLLINNFGQEWETGHIRSKTAYKAGTGDEINATVSLKIALRGINITLHALPNPNTTLEHETINYNERFEWTWDQGRFGFGPYAGHLQQQFRAAQYRGLPLPILWVVDYFVIDGEGQRYGRFYRTAGWYTHILMWTAFPFWLLAIILFNSVISYGAYCLGICGALQLMANIVYLLIRNPIPLSIPFEEATLVTKFGFNYWCTLVIGFVCLFLSVVVLFLDYKYDQQLYNFFGVNPLNSYDEVLYLTKEERMLLRRDRKITGNDIPLVEIDQTTSDAIEEIGDADGDDSEYVPVFVKRRTIRAPKVNRSIKPTRYQVPLPPPGDQNTRM